MAQTLLVALLMALDIYKVATVPPRCNSAFQAAGSGQCGQFVLHWINDQIRKFLGEGSSAGYPAPEFWSGRIQSLAEKIIKNKHISLIQVSKAEKAFEMEAHAKDMQAKMAASIKSSMDLQEEVSKMARLQAHGSFGNLGGCPKCKFAQFGSTCCNPQKMEAKKRAEYDKAQEIGGEPVEGQYSKERYKFHMVQVGLEIIKAKTGQITQPPTSHAPGGGDWSQVTLIFEMLHRSSAKKCIRYIQIDIYKERERERDSLFFTV